MQARDYVRTVERHMVEEDGVHQVLSDNGRLLVTVPALPGLWSGHDIVNHHYRRYANWQPFPIYFPHFHRHRITWSRLPWFF